ncbi:hypothetical protein [Lachnoclostridium sp.]|uniref:hypothetical protein n=1 Tax=Lachnoclostridium sp. TaxID=2028282 RepID=UPI00289FDDC5|nr:hypothetical protein [Lachnoclostridium sp.]
MVQQRTHFLTIVEMAKSYHLNLYEYLKFLFEQRPSDSMTDEELSKLAPWDENVQQLCNQKCNEMISEA